MPMRFLKADSVFDGTKFLPGSTVVVVNERGAIEDLLPSGSLDAGKTETLKGVITPGFINSHCHLELSHLKGEIPEHTGLPAFGRHIMAKRDQFTAEQMQEAIAAADEEMFRNGIVAVGDISNGNASFKTKSQSKIQYHTFIELLGLHPERAVAALNSGQLLYRELEEAGLSASLAPHAPYSTSLELIEQIAEFNLEHKHTSTIHNQESEEEQKFFHGEPSGFDELYKWLKIDITWFKRPLQSSLEYYNSALKSQPTLLVHNTFTSVKDLSFTRSRNTLWCFCPNANLYIENRLPDFTVFKNEKFCIGTDSLASNYSLDLLSEANLILKHSDFTIGQMLSSITSAPADFIGFKGLGSIKKGSTPGLNLVSIENNQINLIKKLI